MITPLSLVVRTLFVLGFLVVGPIIYFFEFNKSLWIFFLVSVFIFIGLFFSENKIYNKLSNLNSTPAFMIFVLLFFVVIVLGVIINYSSIGSAILSLRWYFFVWPIIFVFMLGGDGPKLVDRIWRFLLLVAALQFPIVLFQYFFVSLSSKRASPWDAVVGTFPGAIDGGGQSAAMGLFVIVMILAAYALWRAEKISANRFLIQAVCGVMTLAFAEVKAAVLLLPLLFVLYYGRDILRRPVESGLPVLVALCLTVLLLSAYEPIHYDQIKKDRVTSIYTGITAFKRVLGAVNPEKKRMDENDIGRVSHLILWGEQNLRSKDILHALLGHGIGATQASSIWPGEIAKLYPYRMDVSSSVILLWETGIFGHLVFVLMLLYAARESARLSRSDLIPDLHKIFLRVGYVALLLLIITLPYKNFVLRSVPTQLLLALFLGQVLYWLGVLGGVSRNPKSLNQP
ncbi:MAG: hypothetical protein V7718_01770 [Porticoccus sp.]